MIDAIFSDIKEISRNEKETRSNKNEKPDDD
jgi:hypothetical protein